LERSENISEKRVPKMLYRYKLKGKKKKKKKKKGQDRPTESLKEGTVISL
jgi:hypothetical protein